MKRALAAGMTAVVLSQSPALAGELLINPGLDAPADHETDIATGWTLVEPNLDSMNMPVNSATFASFANHNVGGTRGLWYRSFEGGLGDDEPFQVHADLYQDVPATPGAAYSLSAWYRFEANYSGTDGASPTETILALEFFDAGNALIGAAFSNADLAYPGTADWFQVSVNGVAPAGTVSVRARSSMIGGVMADQNPQSAFVDDFSLVPAPSSVVVLLAPALLLTRRRRSA